MTRPERLLAVVGIAVVASAVLLMMYVRQSNPADAHASGCSDQSARLGQTLDQVRFSTSAVHAISTAVADTVKTRDQYLTMIAANRRQLPALHLRPTTAAAVEHDLGQAAWILNAQDAPLQQARAIVAEQQHEISSATPMVSEASADLRDEDCSALSLTLARSGWPKDRMIAELSTAARLNSGVSDKLDSALGLIVAAQHEAHPVSVASH
jgi:hypothetical protein